MAQDPTIFTLDAAAIKAGGEKGGLYLDMLGKTDLATMTGEQWQDFLTYIVEGAWRFALDRHIASVESNDPRAPGQPITDKEVPF